MSDSLSEIRLRLVTARADLRTAEDYYHAARLRAEIGLLEKMGGDSKAIGTSEADRKRVYEITVEADSDCQLGQQGVRDCQLKVEQLQASLDIMLDIRRERDLSLRERNIALMESWQANGGDVIESEHGLEQPSLIP